MASNRISTMNPCDLRFDRQSPRLIELGINDQYYQKMKSLRYYGRLWMSKN